MKYAAKAPAVLLLEDGTVFHGKAAGAPGTATGEICFNTGMTGYQEIFTDPSYYGQVIVATTPHIGNYGVHEDEVESESIKISGLICRKFSESFSRPCGESSIRDYFERHKKVVICDVDTRAVVRHIRNKGAMNCIISSVETDIEKLKRQLAEIPSMEGLELSGKVCTKEAYLVGEENAGPRVALLDIGVKKNIIRCLTERGCSVKVFPMSTSFEEIQCWQPNGVMLSNGPGDPSAMPEVVETVKTIVNSGLPVFGICLGHQILALSQGLKTEKMFNGHRGINHPVINLLSGKCEVTSQNHGFVVNMETAMDNPNIEITHKHLNDHTLAGFRIKDKYVFSVQYHPEASPGPHDSGYLFDQFIENIVEAENRVIA